MEDAYFFKEISKNEFIFGVLDGHGGQQIVQYLTEKLPLLLEEKLLKLSNKVDIREQINEVFQEIDKLIHQNLSKQAQEVGSTCTICILRIENGQKVLYSANIGDTKAIICAKENYLQITEDHRGSNTSELERIKRNGGFVSMGRIQGVLEVSRAFGDLKFQQVGFVCITPFINRIVLDDTMNQQYQIIVASDGLWDYVRDQKIQEITLRDFTNSKNVAKNLVIQAKQYNSRDNICVMSISIDFKEDCKQNVLG